MRTRLAILALAVTLGAPVRASERVVLDGVALRLPAGYGVARDGAGALGLRSVEGEAAESLRRGEAYRVAFRDMGRADAADAGPVVLVTASRAADAGAGEAPASTGSVENPARWLGRPERAYATDRFERRDYWVRTGMAQAPLAHVSCGEDGCRVGARLSGAVAVEIVRTGIRETADLTAQASSTLRALLFPEP